MNKFLRIFTTVILILIILAAMAFSCLIYAFKIEPYRLKTEMIELGNTDGTSAFTIVQFTDTHIKEDFTAENLSKVVDEINALSTDFVVFTGDLYDNYSVYNDDHAIISELSRINANVGKIAIRGNRDYGGSAVRQYENIMSQGGFMLLTNQNTVFTLDSGISILFTGIDDSLMGNPSMPVADVNDVDYSVFLSHEPDVIEDYHIENYDLILCGHTHGGQIDIPFLPFINEYALNETTLSSKYDGGLTELETKNSPTLYINTGIGTTRISARFLVVPEIAEFNIYL